MNITVRVTKIGNSMGVILPKEVIRRRHLSAGDPLSLHDDGMEITLKVPDDSFDEQMAAARDVMARRRRALRELAK